MEHGNWRMTLVEPGFWNSGPDCRFRRVLVHWLGNAERETAHEGAAGRQVSEI